MEANQDHILSIKMDGVQDYRCDVKLSCKVPKSEQMTAFLFSIDFVKERLGVMAMTNSTTALHFDAENLTTPEEVL